jgi:hypothetical protein
VAHAVEIAGIEERNAGIERGVDRGDALAAVGWAIKVGHAHAAKSDGRDFRAVGAELSILHSRNPMVVTRTRFHE